MGEKENRRYEEIKERIRLDAVRQANEANIAIPTEPLKIAEMTDVYRKRTYQEYYDVANYLLAEYPTELGVYIANAFTNLSPRLGYDPFGKIMVATQYVDSFAGRPTIARLSYINQHPKFYEFMTERDCPERTEKAIDFLTTGIFQFKNVDYVRKIYPKMFVVPEMEIGVENKLHSIDQELAKYIIG